MKIIIDIPDDQIEKSLEESKYIHENEGEKGSVHIVLLYTNKKLEFVDISRKTDFYSLTDKYTILPEGHCEDIHDKIRTEIESKCDRINSLTSVLLPYTIHRGIQELLCEIMDLIKESEG